MSAGNAAFAGRVRVFMIGAIVAMGCALLALPALAQAAPPIANPAFTATNDVTPVVVNLSASDGNSPPVAFSIVSPPSGGALGTVTDVPPSSAAVTYTANPTFAGVDTFDFRATNADGQSDGTATVIVRPQTSLDSGPGGPINTKTPTWTFSSPQSGTTFQCRIDGGAWTACTSPFTPAALSEGAHTFDVRANAGGGVVDTSPASISVFVDSVPPFVTLEQAPGQADPTNATPISFRLSSNENLDAGTVTAGDFSVTNGSVASVSGTGDTYTIEVTPTADGAVSIAPSPSFSVADTFGNAATTAAGTDRSVTYDTTPANVVLEQANDQADPTNVAAIKFSFYSNEPLQASSVEDSDFTATNGTVSSVTGSGSSYTVTVTAAADGPVSVAPSGTFSVLDIAGNASTTAAGADRTVTYDSTPAVVSLEQAPGQVDPSPIAAVQFQLSSNEDLLGASVTASDFTVTNGTITGITGGPTSFTIAVTGTAQGAISIAPSGTFSVSDIAGNGTTTADGTDRTVIFDLPPVVTLEQAPGQADPTNNATISFRLSSTKDLNPATVEPSDFDVTNGSVASIGGSGDTYTIEVTAAADGVVSIAPSATFEVRSTPSDFAQSSIGGTDRSVTYDSTGPVTTITSSPGASSFDRTPTFEFSATDALGSVTGYECSLVPQGDPASYSACTSPFTSPLLAPGDYTFRVRASDNLGNTGSAASQNWTILPSPIVATSPIDPYYTRGGAPVAITIDASDPNPGTLSYSFVTSTEGGSLSSFTAGPTSGSASYTAANGFAGTDTVTVRVRNTVTDAFTDTTFDVIVRPKTVLLTGPGVGSNNAFTPDSTPTFTFDAVSGPGDVSVASAVFSCSLDGAPLPSIECAGGSYTPSAPLSDGPHTFEVAAAKPAINQDIQPQSVTFTVDTVNPDPPVIVSGTQGLTNNNDLSFNVEIPEGTAECRLSRTGGPVIGWEQCDDGNDAFTVSYPDVADGEYLFEVRTVDAATNRSTIVDRSMTVDTVVNVTIDSAPADGNSSLNPQIEFSSPEDPDVTYGCRLFPAGTAEADKPAFVTCLSPVSLPDLDRNIRYRFEVKGMDPAGNETVASAEWDQTNNAPAVPSPDVTVEAGQQVEIDLGSTDLDNDALSYAITSPVTGGTLGTINQSNGKVTFTAAGDAAGVYTFDFTADDGREDGVTTGTATVRIQPQTEFVSVPPAETNNQQPTWTFSSPSGVTTFECNLDGGGWVACDGGSYTPDTPLSEGVHTLEVRAVKDALKDPTPVSDSVIIDITAPVTTIDSNPVALSNVAAPTFTFSSTDASAVFECSVDNGPFAACSSPFTTPALADGQHSFAVRAIDPATNVGPEDTYSWEVDLTDPVISLGGVPDGVTNGPSADKQTNARRPVWYFQRSDLNLIPAQVRCRVDNQAWLETCLSPFQPPNNLSDGLHTLTIQADDGAGNTGELSFEFRVDTVAPTAIITSGPSTSSPNGPDVSFSFVSSKPLGPDGSFACRTRLGSGAFGAWDTCSSPLSLTGLSTGIRTLEVKAIDSAGNESTGDQVARYQWSTTGGAPETAITGTTINNLSAAFSFNSPNTPAASFQCSLDNGPWGACTSPRSYSNLAAGEHTFRVRAVNDASTVDATPASHTWTATAPTAPDTIIESQPPASTPSTSATFGFVSSVQVATFECKLDSASWQACTSPTTLTGLSVGAHTFQVRSTNPNTGLTDQTPASVTWTVTGPSAPAVTITKSPPTSTTSRSASFEFSPESAVSGFECSLDNAPFAACTSPRSYSSLTLGEHTFRVRSVAAPGVVGATASHTWTVVAPQAPDVTITQQPPASTSSRSATIAFTSTALAQGGFECSLDNASFEPCSSPKSLTNLSVGAHNLRIRAIGEQGAVGAVSTASWTVVAVSAPDTSITRQPPATTTATEATFEFSSNSIATFECRIDGGAWAACDGPKTYTGLALGAHTFEVRSTDSNGTDQSPASATWTIVDSLVDPLPAELAPPFVTAPKKLKSGKAMTVTVGVTNVGGTTTTAQVCLSAPKGLAKVNGSRCRSVAVGAGATVRTKFKVKTKPKKKGKQIKLTATASYVKGDGTKKKEFVGHVTLLK